MTSCSLGRTDQSKEGAPDNEWEKIIAGICSSANAAEIIEQGLLPISAWNEDKFKTEIPKLIDSAANKLEEPFYDAFCTSLIDHVTVWALESFQARLAPFIDFVALSLLAPFCVPFLMHFESVIPHFFSQEMPLDLNLFLTLQAPIFDYTASQNVMAAEVYNIWFRPIIEKEGSQFFGDDIEMALSYFKLMNHAFFRAAISTESDNSTLGAAMDAFFVDILCDFRGIISKIAEKRGH